MNITPIIETIPVNVCLENGEATLAVGGENNQPQKSIKKGNLLFSNSGYNYMLSLYHRYSDLLLLSISKSQLIDFYINKYAKFQSFGFVDESFPYEFYHNGIIQRGYWWCDDDMVVRVGKSELKREDRGFIDNHYHVIAFLGSPEQIYQLFMRAAESLFELTFNHKPIERLCSI